MRSNIMNIFKINMSLKLKAQWAGAVEYTNCISTNG